MNKLFVTIMFLMSVCATTLLASTPAFAERYTVVTTAGGFDFVSGSDGYSGMGKRTVSGAYYYNDNR